MTESVTPAKGRVRLRRWAVLGVPGVVATAALTVLTAQGALAVSFNISSMAHTINADKLSGTGLAQYGGRDRTSPNNPIEKGVYKNVFITTIKDAEITNLCQAVQIGAAYLKITAGGKGTPAAATNLATDSDVLTGKSASFSGLEMGRDASELNKSFSTGPAGTFGLQADTIEVKNVYQHNWATTAGAMTLPDLRIELTRDGCPGEGN
ncbi:DUF6230 family protein [Streptomyces abyssomicinicus]|uniref:DUF6230 family protein n=1 Tax=Streptomyces abyssomicinicus TaxID=574929 RepID=UPI00125055E4|nr:DUF6230 family protein [Streptomyces abyssomicinicus]